MLVWREIESFSVFQSLMIEENVINSDRHTHTQKTQNEQANKNNKKKNRRIYYFGDLEQITAIVPFSLTLGLLVCMKMKESF